MSRRFAPVLAFVALASAASPAVAQGGCEGLRCGCATRSAFSAINEDLTATFFGVSTLMFDDGNDRVLTDGFFTRPGLLQTLFWAIRSSETAVTDGLGLDYPPLRAVLTAHAHHDHALDTLRIASERPEAVIIGTSAVAALAIEGDVPLGKVCAARRNDVFDFGRFQITALEAEHGHSPKGLRLLLDRELVFAPTGWAWFGRYKDNENRSWQIKHGGLTILIHPSAGNLMSAAPMSDVVFLGMGQVGKMDPDEAHAYFTNILQPSVKLVVPVHWDQFTTRPGEPFVTASWPFDDVSEGFDRLCQFLHGRDVKVVKLGRGARISLPSGDVDDPEGGSTILCSP